MNSRPIPLAPDYRAEFPCLQREEWNELLSQFTDASLYQTWDYDAVRCGERNLSHLVLKRGEEVVAVAQARLAGLHGLGFGAAYVRWGPVWRRRGQADDVNALRMALRALRNEYMCRQGLFLRILPLAYDGEDYIPPGLFSEELFVPTPDESPQQTVFLNVEGELSEIRKGFDQKWRNCLNHAERNSLVITQGTDDGMFVDFISLYRELLARKKFKESNDINEFRQIQASLPEALKMRIFLCTENGTLTGGAICSAMGSSALYLFGATNDMGLKNKGAYLLQWHALQWVKDRGCKNYNLNGINPKTNPGSYHFKAGLAGKGGQKVHYLGRFDCYGGIAATTTAFLGLRALPLALRMLDSLKAINRTVRGSPSS